MMVFHAKKISIYCSLFFALRETGAWGLVVHHVSGPYVFDHVPASFGFSHALTERPVTIAQPDHGCPGVANQQPSSYAGASNASTKLLQPDHGGKVLIIQRGQCNFTEKILLAQAGNAAAVIVLDEAPREENRWGVIMSSEFAYHHDAIRIPSVFVSFETGEALRSLLTDKAEPRCTVTVNETGNVLLPAYFEWGPAETLVLWAGACMITLILSAGLNLATKAGRRALDTRALRKLELRKWVPYAIAKEADVCSGGALASQGDGKDSVVCEKGEILFESTGCAICLDEYACDDWVRVLPCRHAFHDGCVMPWFQRGSNQCPLCKRQVLAPRLPANLLASLFFDEPSRPAAAHNPTSSSGAGGRGRDMRDGGAVGGDGGNAHGEEGDLAHANTASTPTTRRQSSCGHHGRAEDHARPREGAEVEGGLALAEPSDYGHGFCGVYGEPVRPPLDRTRAVLAENDSSRSPPRRQPTAHPGYFLDIPALAFLPLASVSALGVGLVLAMSMHQTTK